MTELRECPFCGGEVGFDTVDKYDVVGFAVSVIGVVCEQCDFRHGAYHDHDFIPNKGLVDVSSAARQNAAKAWNTRHDDWRPISSAPKDGLRFLAYQKFGDPDVYECWWGNPAGRSPDWESDSKFEPVPTHWKPLPQPPKE